MSNVEPTIEKPVELTPEEIIESTFVARAENASRYAIVQDGVVVNVVMWDGNTDTWSPQENQTTIELTDASVGIGDTYSKGVFERPASVESDEPADATQSQLST